jgi:hypothetical protein
VLALAVCGGCLATYVVFASEHVPPPRNVPEDGVRRFVWIGPGHKGHFSNESPWEVDLLLLGDSRCGTGFDVPALEAAGFGKTTSLWGGASLTAPLVDFACTTDAEALVVSLTVVGLAAATPPWLMEALNERPVTARRPPGQPEATRREVAEWGRALAERLEPRHADVIRNETAAELEESRRRARVWSANFDGSLDTWLERQRNAILHPIDPSELRTRWLRVDSEDRARDFYARGMNDEARAIVAAQRPLLVASLRAALAAGKRVACVRLPTSPLIRDMEDDWIGAGYFVELCHEAGVPYLEMPAELGWTGDGSHLHADGQTWTTQRLVQWLRDELRWGNES